MPPSSPFPLPPPKSAPLNVPQALAQALALHEQGRLNEAERLYGDILAARPDHFDALQMLALVKHAKGDAAEALRLVSAAMHLRKPSPQILLNYGMILHSLKRSEEAIESFDQAIKLKSKFAEAHNNRGAVLTALGRHEEAIESYRKALRINPNDEETHYNLGNSLSALGRHEEALKSFERALALRPNHFKAHTNRGVALHALGRLADALASFERAVAIEPRFAEAHNNRGVVLSALARDEEALVALRRALDVAPNYVDALYNSGTSLRALGRYEEAVGFFDRVLALKPDHRKAHNNRGAVLEGLERLREALDCYDRALALDPRNGEARDNRGRVLVRLDRADEALANFDLAISHNPTDAEAYCNRGKTLIKLSRNDDAAADFAQALALKPGFPDARFAACFAELPVVYADASEIGRRRAAYEEKLRALADDIEAGRLEGDLVKAIADVQPFLLAYQGGNDRALQGIYGGMVDRIIRGRYEPPALPPPPAPGEPIRVGVVSAFFHLHSNWKIPIKGWLGQFDRSRFKIFGYHVGPRRDAETDVAAGMCDRFVHRVLDLDGWRREILADAPHVLIYPGLLMDNLSLQLAAQRLAPVQMNSWGHPETSGLPTLDYFLSSDLMEPAGADAHYTEKLVRLPNLSFHYEPSTVERAAVTRAGLGLRPDATVFWSAQSLYKYLPQYDHVFAEIARRAGNCQFVFVRHNGGPRVTEVTRERLERAFAAAGLRAADHCVYLPRMSQSEFIAAAGLCDAFLDSLGWSGCNSAMESLEHDIPIVTWQGPMMRGRHSAAILRMMGITDTIAASIEDYIDIAARLAGDAPARQALRGRIAQNKHRLYRDRACVAALEDLMESAVRPAPR